jgi:Lrp/AsnC family transcriptional regulator for asnA, asnC and gidA
MESAPVAARGPVSRPRSLDRVDQAIVEALQENGREPFRRIAASIGVAEATVRARYNRLVADEISSWPEASYVVVTAGRFDVLVELVCEDRQHLLEATNRIRALDGVETTESFLYLQLVKQIFTWGTR